MDAIKPVHAPRLPERPATTPPPLEDHAEWRELALSGADLSGGRARGLEIADATFARCNLANLTVLKGAITRCAFTACRMTGFAFADSTIEDARFSDCLVDLAALGYTHLRRAIFSDCVLRDSDLSHARLEHVRFHRCRLQGASFTGARFSRSEMRGCSLDDVRGIDGLRGVAMEWSDVVGLAGTMAAAIGIEVIDG